MPEYHLIGWGGTCWILDPHSVERDGEIIVLDGEGEAHAGGRPARQCELHDWYGDKTGRRDLDDFRGVDDIRNW